MTTLYLLVTYFLFIVGVLGIVMGRKNLILMIISIELLLLALTFSFVLIGWGIYGDFKVIMLCIFLLSIGASESAIGLALAISYYKNV